MRLTAPPLGGKNQRSPGGEGHRLLGRGDASEALQEVEEVILQTQCSWSYRRGAFALLDREGWTNHRASKTSGAYALGRRDMPQITHVQALVYGVQESRKLDGMRTRERDIRGKDARTHRKTLAVGGVAHTVTRH